MSVPKNIKDPKLYKFAESESRERPFSSEQYRRTWTENRYRSLGGKFKEEKGEKGMPKNIADPEIYKFVEKEADEKFDAGGAVDKTYMSREQWINRRYLDLGGKKLKGDETIDKRTERIDTTVDIKKDPSSIKSTDVPSNVKNPSLYKQAKREADKKFDEKTSAYKSMWIVKRYKELGGEYSTTSKAGATKATKKDTGETSRWLKEKWIQVIPFITKNQEIVCGSDVRTTKACRPLKKVDKKTPLTVKEIVKKHGKEKVVELASEKNIDMKGRLDWTKGVFKPSKIKS